MIAPRDSILREKAGRPPKSLIAVLGKAAAACARKAAHMSFRSPRSGLERRRVETSVKNLKRFTDFRQEESVV